VLPGRIYTHHIHSKSTKTGKTLRANYIAYGIYEKCHQGTKNQTGHFKQKSNKQSHFNYEFFIKWGKGYLELIFTVVQNRGGVYGRS